MRGMTSIAKTEGVKARPICFGSYNVPSDRNEDRYCVTVFCSDVISDLTIEEPCTSPTHVLAHTMWCLLHMVIIFCS